MREDTLCLVACVHTEWYDVGLYSKVCGGGKTPQARHQTKNAGHGGECPTVFTRKVECNPFRCPTACEM